MKKIFLSLLIFISSFNLLVSQAPKQLTSGEIYESLEQFNFLGNALYVAAHPDDENTRLISYLVNEVNAHTTYLSLTRGDGGQNLIGPEISELLGVIRTQELLAARRTDGGNQMFTRANDFGYSKTPNETINIWDDELVKHDVVWAIRKLRPDVIINRFDHSGNRKTHGHHTASAMLSYELFEKASNPNAYPEQLQYVSTWKPSRLFFNTSWWFYGSREKFDEADKSDMMSVDIGTYYPLLGKSNNEIAAESRSKHKCQGFGSTGSRGSQLEYVKLLKGSMPKNKDNIFEGINTTWTRVKGGNAILSSMNQVMNNFNFAYPEKSIPALMKVYKQLDNLEDDFWKVRKKDELREIIKACLGLYTEAIASQSSAVNGEQITIDIEITKRLKGNVDFIGYKIQPSGIDTVINKAIQDNEPYYQNSTYTIPMSMKHTAPYWLEKEGSLGMYNVDELQLIGLPETPRPLKAIFDFKIEGIPFSFEQEVAYKYNSPEDGEVFQPFEITPELFVDVENKVYIFADHQPRTVQVIVTSGANNQQGKVSIPLPDGWSANPEYYDFNLEQKGESQSFRFDITPPEDPSDIIINPIIESQGRQYTRKLIEIDYDHIPLQTVLRPAQSRLVKINIQKRGNNIAYIMGAGDDIPSSIKQIGYRVTELSLEEVSLERLQQFDALILGVRAYNTLDDIKFKQKTFMEYVNQGGTMLVQYNTNRRLRVDQPGPYPLNISRDRVTVEQAEIRMLQPDHEVLNHPNKITDQDFEGWVQERGLYFPDQWDENYEAILSSNDPDESPKDGGLLVAKYGQGYYVYSGYSWFRQLPAGVPGAYRLFANILSLGNETRP